MKMVRVNECSSYPGVNYEEVLEQGDSILVRVIASSSYRGFELSGLYCTYNRLITSPQTICLGVIVHNNDCASSKLFKYYGCASSKLIRCI